MQLLAAPLQVRFVGFDFSGVAGEARYPPFLNPALRLPEGAAVGAPITQRLEAETLDDSFSVNRRRRTVYT